jgi:hypothetical protein
MYLRPSAFSGAPCVAAELDHARTHAFGYAIKLVSAWPGLAWPAATLHRMSHALQHVYHRRKSADRQVLACGRLATVMPTDNAPSIDAAVRRDLRRRGAAHCGNKHTSAVADRVH